MITKFVGHSTNLCGMLFGGRCGVFEMTGKNELQYNNRARIPEAPHILRQWTEDSATYRSELAQDGRAELNVAYGEGPRHIVDMFWPKEDLANCIVVFIHGGYWQLFEPALFSHLARGPNARGLPVAMMGYDLCPTVEIPQIVAQIRAACVFLWQRHRRRIILTGHSAGGHLTAAMMATDWAVEGIDPDFIAAGLSISGVFELTPLLDTSMNNKLRMTESSARAVSPIHATPRPGAEIDAWVGGAESAEFKRQSGEFVDQWAKKGARTKYEVVDGANHFTIIASLTDPHSRMMDRLCEMANGMPQSGLA
jgi:arylformamidase